MSVFNNALILVVSKRGQLYYFSKSIRFSSCVLVFLMVVAFPAPAPANENIQFYGSTILGMGDVTPSFNAEESFPRRKWFDDQSILHTRNSFELGANDTDSGFGIGLRSRSFDGYHRGATAAYDCLLSFCSWISGNVIDPDQKQEDLRYKISNHQIWIKRNTQYDRLSFGAKLGVNYLSLDADLATTLQTIKLKNELLLPLFGLNAKYTINERWDIATDFGYVNISQDGKAAKLIETELELGVKIESWLRIAVGYNRMLLNLRRRSETADTSLSIPQQRPYLRVMITY